MMTRPYTAGTRDRGLCSSGGARALVGLAGGTLGLLLLAGGAGCASDSDSEKDAVALSPIAFRTGTAPKPVVTDASAPTNGVAANGPDVVPAASASGTGPVKSVEIVGTAGARQSRTVSAEPGVVAVADQAPATIGPANTAGRDVLADCMVGQVNGRPVFASEVLDPLEGQLQNAARTVKTPSSANEWLESTYKLIESRVQARVRDELLLGEARARLTPEARQGLIYFLQRVDQWASGQQGGSRVQAEEAALSRQGVSYDKYLEMQRDEALIQELVKDNVTPNVRVPWRRVERFYEENQDVINPPPRAVMHIVMIDASEAEAVAKAEAAAAAKDGAAFKELAASPANKFTGKDIVTKQDIREGKLVRWLDKPFAEIEWVGNATWNQAAATLQPESVTGPIEMAGYKVWMRRGSDMTQPHRSLEDSQLEIMTALLKAKENQERTEFFRQLLGKGSFTPITRMTRELLVLAAQRHLPSDIAGAVRDAIKLNPDTAPVLERSPTPPPTALDDVSLNPPKPSTKPAPAVPAVPAPPATPAPSTPPK